MDTDYAPLIADLVFRGNLYLTFHKSKRYGFNDIADIQQSFIKKAKTSDKETSFLYILYLFHMLFVSILLPLRLMWLLVCSRDKEVYLQRFEYVSS